MIALGKPEEEIMRVTLAWILILFFFGWQIWSGFSSGDWREGALPVVMVVAFAGVSLRKIWGKYLVYFLAVTGVLWVAYQVWLGIVTGQLFTREGGLAAEIGATLATIIALFALAALLFLCIGSSYVVHCQYKKMERDLHVADDTGSSSPPPSKSSGADVR